YGEGGSGAAGRPNASNPCICQQETWASTMPLAPSPEVPPTASPGSWYWGRFAGAGGTPLPGARWHDEGLPSQTQIGIQGISISWCTMALESPAPIAERLAE